MTPSDQSSLIGGVCVSSPHPPPASILYLEGAELSVLQLSTNERLCVKFEFLSKLKHHHKRVRP